MQEHLREATEKGLGDSRATYARLKTVAEDANQSLETGYAVALEGVAAIGAKSVDVLRSNTEAGLDFFKALVSVKTLTEALEVQSSHMRKQFEMLTTQGKDLAALAQKVANDTTAPLKANVGKVFARAN